MVGVTIGTGIGAGVVIGRRLYGGQYMGAGEIGSFPYLDLILNTIAVVSCLNVMALPVR